MWEKDSLKRVFEFKWLIKSQGDCYSNLIYFKFSKSGRILIGPNSHSRVNQWTKESGN